MRPKGISTGYASNSDRRYTTRYKKTANSKTHKQCNNSPEPRFLRDCWQQTQIPRPPLQTRGLKHVVHETLIIKISHCTEGLFDVICFIIPNKSKTKKDLAKLIKHHIDVQVLQAWAP